MCACEPGYLCPKCEGTPADPLYELNEYEPPEPPEPPEPVYAESE